MFLSWSIKSTLNSFKFIKTLKYKKTTIEQTYSLQYIRILVSTTKFSTSLRDALRRHSQNIRQNQLEYCHTRDCNQTGSTYMRIFSKYSAVFFTGLKHKLY